jgi:hypothetical protein
MKRPAIEEIMKYLTVIHGCPKNQFPEEWIKKMTNWDLFTNPEADEFHISTPSHEKQKLASDWKEYMQKNECWLSFYSWKKSSQSLSSQVIGEPSETPSHKWKTVDGTEIESKTTFPPFKSLVLESESATAKAIPLLIDTGNQLSGIEKRVQNVSEQINWTNTALRGMATQVYQTKSVNPEQLVDLQVSTNTTVNAVNQLQDRVLL